LHCIWSLIMTYLKVKLVWQDTGFCVNYYKVVEGKNEGVIICAIDIMEKEQEPVNWHTCGGVVEGEPDYPINKEKYSIEVLEESQDNKLEMPGSLKRS